MLASLVAQMVKCLPIMQETWVQSLGWDDLLAKEMATHSSILAWKNPMDWGSWQATVHGVSKSWTRLSDFAFFLSCCTKSGLTPMAFLWILCYFFEHLLNNITFLLCQTVQRFREKEVTCLRTCSHIWCFFHLALKLVKTKWDAMWKRATWKH